MSAGMKNGPTLVMRREHQMILAALTDMERAIEAGDAGRFRAAHAALVGCLGAHNEKEERVIYPMTDRALSPDERLDLLTRLRKA